MKRTKIIPKPVNKAVNALVKLLLGLALASGIFAVVYFSTGPSPMRLYEGDVSLKDIYAPYDFIYTRDIIDDEKMKEAERMALANVGSVYILNPQIAESINQSISTFFKRVRESRGVKELIGDDEKVKSLKIASDINLNEKTYLALINTADLDSLERAVGDIITRYLKKGILTEEEKSSLKERGSDTIVVLDPLTSTETKMALESTPAIEETKREIEKVSEGSFQQDKKIRQIGIEVVKALIASNLQMSPEETKRYSENILSKLPRIYKKIEVKKNELLIGKGEKVAKRHLNMLKQLEKTPDIGGRTFYLIGMGLLLVIFLLIFVFHLRYYESRIFSSNRNLILISLLVLFIAVLSEVVAISPLSSYMIPLASVSMLIAILLDANSAFISTVIMSILVGVIGGNNFDLMIVMFIGGSVGIYSVRKVRRRSGLLLAGLVVGAANFFTIIALGLLNNLEPSLILKESSLGITNGLASFMLVMALLPVCEYIFKIPTDITLLELSDLNHPLLKRMATEAPGTYHHSLIVGNLAEAACDAINANSLLARVGAYYHDIGKTEKSEYFSENEIEPKNSRHDNLTPSMSALVIINHVKDGMEMAHKYKINQAIIDFIAQHHGNGLIYYFYQRALEKSEDEKDIREEDFRYPGPRPQTKETAAVLLADSVEASSRTLANPTPSRVQGLVQRIINNKFIDGQLNECDLTLKDLHKISEAFTRILNAMFHTRVEYPDEDEKKRPSKDNNRKPDQRKNSQDLFTKENSREHP